MENIRNLISGVLFDVLVGCTLYLALLLFSLDQSFVIDIQLLFNINCLLIHLIICYTYCYLFERITLKSFQIGEDAHNLMWYKMNGDQQRAMILIIQRSQIEFRLSGLGLIDCSLATFLTVRIHILDL